MKMKHLVAATAVALVMTTAGFAFDGKRIDVRPENVNGSKVASMVEDLRSKAQYFVFLSGGASKMTEESRTKLIQLFDAFRLMSEQGIHFGVADGGTKAGIMEAAGDARKNSGNAFNLLGISPGPEITTTDEEGKTAVDPNHSHLMAVFNDPWLVQQKTYGWEPSWGFWGSETKIMYEVFSKLDEGRSSVTIVANGGGITLDEVSENIKQGRRMIVLKGSGRGADAIVSLLENTVPTDEEVIKRVEKSRKIGVLENRELFTIFPISRGAEAFARIIGAQLDR
jgi:hypothetical protein